MNLQQQAAAYAGRKAGDAVAGIRERTQDSLGKGTFGLIVLLVAVLGSLIIPSDWFSGWAGYVLPVVALLAWLLTGNIVVRIKRKVVPEFALTLRHSHGMLLVSGLTFVAVALKTLFPAATILWLIVSAVLTVMSMVLGARAALAGVKEAADEVAREERLALLIATCLGVRGATLLERYRDGDVDMSDTYDGGILVELPEEFWHTLIDEAKVTASFATFAPEYEIGEGDIEPSQGTLVLHPVTVETHVARQNLRDNANITSDEVEFDFGDAVSKVKRVDYGSAESSGGTDDFGI